MLAKKFHDIAIVSSDTLSKVRLDMLYQALISIIAKMANNGEFRLMRPISHYDCYSHEQMEQVFSRLKLEGFKCNFISKKSINYYHDNKDCLPYICIEW